MNDETQIPRFPLKIILLNEYTNGSELYREVNIADEKIVLRGLSLREADKYPIDTWTDKHGNIYKFERYWIALVTEEDLDASMHLGVSATKCQEIIDKGYSLVFISDYNGTHFKEVILIANATAFSWPYTGDDPERDYYGFFQDHDIKYEVNRTEYFGNETSEYNPALALYIASKYLKAKNFTYDFVVNVFLIPNDYSNYAAEFIWDFAYIRVISSAEKHFIIYHFVVNPYGKILSFEMFEVKGIKWWSPSDLGPIAYFLTWSISFLLLMFMLIAIYIRWYKSRHRCKKVYRPLANLFYSLCCLNFEIF
ncbi:MAG: hypothetical protein ACP6IU_11425 [Candidatus Asgardarchaeia archaeon]